MPLSLTRTRAAAALCALLLLACSKKADTGPSVYLNEFERVPDPALLKLVFDPAEALKRPSYPAHDFDVHTSGYAKVSAITKDDARAAKDKALYKFIQGKTAAKVRFTVPSDYRKKSDEFFPRTWESGFDMSIDSRTPLKLTDWKKFNWLDIPVFNPGPLTQTVLVRFSDSSSTVTQTAVAVPLGEAVLEIPLKMLSEARLNPADIKSVAFLMDTAEQDKDPVLIFDAIGVHGLTAVERAKLESEEGVEEEEEQDWDDEEEGVRKVNAVHPGETPAVPAAPAAVSGPAAAR